MFEKNDSEQFLRGHCYAPGNFVPCRWFAKVRSTSNRLHGAEVVITGQLVRYMHITEHNMALHTL